ncbi:NUDIX domain-containing protein [Streptomyces albidoflavus]
MSDVPGIGAWTDEDLERVAGALGPAVELAVRDFLRVAGERHGLTAAGGHSVAGVWRRIVDRRVRPVAEKLWSAWYERLAGTADGARVAGREFLESLAARTEGFTRRVLRKAAAAEQAGRAQDAAGDAARERVARVLQAGDWSGQVDSISRTQAATLLNASTMAAALYREKTQGGRWSKTWTARKDAVTRPAHRKADGQTRSLAEPFTVGGAQLLFPADPEGPPEQCINCRCRMTVRQEATADSFAPSPSLGDAMTSATLSMDAKRLSFTLTFSDSLTAAAGDSAALQVAEDGSWSGPVGLLDEWSADDRMLATPSSGEIEVRPLPVPVLVQWHLSAGHEGGELGLMRMDRVWQDGRYVMAAGQIDMEDPGGVRLARKIRGKFVRFVSLDVDAATEYRVCVDDAGQPVEGCDWKAAAEAGGRVGRIYEAWRVMGCTVLAHPAFPDAAISLDGAVTRPSVAVSGPDGEVAEEPAEAASAEPLSGPEDAQNGDGELGVGDSIPLPHDEDDPDSAGAVDTAGDGALGESEERTEQLAEDVPTGGPVAAGLVVKALDTGRVLMLQRALIEGDPAAGTWEFPGGGIEDGEDPQTAAVREWAEETGVSLPDDAEFVGSWQSANGVYQGFIAVVPSEGDVPINPDTDNRSVLNPDDPDGDQVEVVAWWDIAALPDMPALRPEARETPWELLLDAGAPAEQDAPPVAEELAGEPVGGCVVQDAASPTGWAPADCAVEGAVPADEAGTGPAETGPAAETVEEEVPGLLLDEDLVPVEAEVPAPVVTPAPDDCDDEDEFTAAASEGEPLAGEVRAEAPAGPGEPAADIGHGCVRYDEAAGGFVPAPCDAPGAVTAGTHGGPVQHGCGCGGGSAGEETGEFESMVASAFAHPSFLPPTEWFRNPKLTGPTLATITSEGRIFGHLALWGVPHVSFQGQKIYAPHSPTGYERFHMRPVRTSDGLVDVGVLAMDTDHAKAWADSTSAVSHYESTGSIIGPIRCGEDAYGIWMAGAVLPDISPDARLRLSLATFSGDWRNEGRGLDLKAALAVPAGHEGFYTPKSGASDRQEYALVASGAVTAEHITTAQQAYAAELDERVAEAVNVALARRDEQAAAEKRASLAAARVQDFRVRRAAERITVQRRGFASRMTMIAVLSREHPGVKLPGTRDVALAKNWVDQQGGLPKHIRKIANELKKKGFDESHAIATAVNVAKKSCAKSGNAKACAAVASWERMKAAANAT